MPKKDTNQDKVKAANLKAREEERKNEMRQDKHETKKRKVPEVDFKLDYEFRVRSQNGEDGIIEKMTDAILEPDHTFLEIGWGDGGANCSNYLQYCKGWGGVGVDMKGKPYDTSEWIDDFELIQQAVLPENIGEICSKVPRNCDFFSLDIDSFDYDIAYAAFVDHGFRPKTVCVEFQHRFGPSKIASFPYKKDVSLKRYRKGKLDASGCSLSKWRRFFEHFGYQYFGFDTTGTNCFFYNKEECHHIDLPILSGTDLPTRNYTKIKNTIKNGFWAKYEDDIYKDVEL